jgi:hypothetical protein
MIKGSETAKALQNLRVQLRLIDKSIRLIEKVEQIRKKGANFCLNRTLLPAAGLPPKLIRDVFHARLTIVTNRHSHAFFGMTLVKLCETLAGFVRLWAEQHITGPDACFAQFLKARGTACEPRVLSVLQEPDCNTSPL